MSPIHDPPKPVETSDKPPESPGVESAAEWEAFIKEADDESRQVEPKTSSSGSAFKVLFGLCVVWGAFYLVAYAQNISYNEVAFNLERSDRSLAKRAFITNLDVREKAMAPMDVRFHQTSSRQIMKLLLRNAGLNMDEADLALLPDKSKDIELSAKPLHDLLPLVIDDPEIGFSLEQRQARFFRQTLKEAEATGPVSSFSWEAVATLTEDPTLFFPSSRSDLWVMLCRKRMGSGATAQSGTIEAELWRGSLRMASGQGTLGVDKKMALDFSAGGKVSVALEPFHDQDEKEATTPGSTSSGKMKIKIEVRGDSSGKAKEDQS